MDPVWVILGAAVIVATLRDIVATLFHPLGRSHIGRWVVGTVSWVGHRLSARFPPATVLIGPIGYIAVVASWAALLIVGWALVFYPFLPEGFSYDSGLVPDRNAGFDTALYISLVDLTSLGYGDISPDGSLLRILGPVETLFGLSLVTASVSWLISIYNTISRRDAFAHEVHLSRKAEERLGEKLADADPELLERLLGSFTRQLVATRRDLIHFPITIHFRSEDEEKALSGLMPFLGGLVDEATGPSRPHALRVRGEMLRMAMDDFADTLRERLGIDGETTEAILGHYDAHQRPGGSPPDISLPWG
ncbi:MAG: two pore domain potassium channel family protein [Solirubrobacterales bacterium]|nr:two pore domain potassium channel family protein [Solirubrobacterales bacterium]